MDDFQAGGDITVNGNINISNNVNSYDKPLDQQSPEELRAARIYRAGLLKKESDRKNNEAVRYFLIAAVVAFGLYIWNYFGGSNNFITALCGLLGVIFPVYIALTKRFGQTDFEMLQRTMLKVIEIRLKELEYSSRSS